MPDKVYEIQTFDCVRVSINHAYLVRADGTGGGLHLNGDVLTSLFLEGHRYRITVEEVQVTRNQES